VEAKYLEDIFEAIKDAQVDDFQELLGIDLLAERHKEVEDVLKAIENVGCRDLRELFRICRPTREEFVNGILELAQNKQEELINTMLQDRTLSLVLGDELQNWGDASDELKTETLEKAYYKMYKESKAVYTAVINPIRKDKRKYNRMRLTAHILDISETGIKVKHSQYIPCRTSVVIKGELGLVGIGFGDSKSDSCKRCSHHRHSCHFCSINNAIESAKDNLFSIPISRTLPCAVVGRSSKTEIRMHPAEPNTGIDADEVVRFVLKDVGIRDIKTELIGSRSRTYVLEAMIDGIKKIPNVYRVIKRPRTIFGRFTKLSKEDIASLFKNSHRK
jgi:ribosomal protein S5